jgi:hypothetical protein
MMQEHHSTLEKTPAREHAMEKGRGINAPIFKIELILYGLSCRKDDKCQDIPCIGSR